MKIPYTNDTDKFVHIGAVSIPPGETREVETTLHPDYQPPAAEVKAPADPLAEIAAGNAKSVIEAIHGLDADALDALEVIEQEGQKRKTVIEAIAARRLQLAAAAAEK